VSRERLRITESALALKFAPQYVAEDLGFFSDEGLDVQSGIDAGPAGSWLVDNLIADRADVALGGIWMPMLYTQIGIARLSAFAAVCHRNPAVIMQRGTPAAPFAWRSLHGRRVLLSLAATSQWMFLEGVLREAAVDLVRIRFVRDLDVRTTQKLWRAGFADYFFVEPALAEELLEEGFAVATTMAEAGGPVPWSVYYARDDVLNRPAGPMPAFARALDRASAWLIEAPLADVAGRLTRRFPSTPARRVERVVKRFRSTGVWQADMRVCPEATSRYRAMMVRYGLLDGGDR
jgi:NitT/TauT family transport system substrate-binding protein